MTVEATLGGDIPELVTVPGGAFLMGKDGSRKDECPAHHVTLGPFRAAIAPVTNGQYLRYVVASGVAYPPFLEDERFSLPQQPAVGISWFDAVAYCAWLRGLSGVPFRLPTEAEREWAALGTLDGGDWPWVGDQHPIAGEIEAMDRPHPPRPECANGFGLRCMAENVHEWCSDWYAADYYAVSPEQSPRGPAEPTRRRSSRGGSWRHREKVTRLNARSSLDPSFRYADFGFRVFADA